jgi:hypothetical protein
MVKQLVNLAVAQLAVAVEKGAALVDGQIWMRRVVPDVLQVLVVQHKQRVATNVTRILFNTTTNKHYIILHILISGRIY